MKPNDVAIATGGISAPLWMPELQMINEWVALLVGLLTISYLCIKLFKLWKDK
jgi:hypothetical protein